MGNVVAALAAAGAFRLGCVLVGTAAYQTYSAMLGEKLPKPLLQTGDVDIAQFASRSRKVADRIALPVLDVLRQADASFSAVPNLNRTPTATSYQTRAGGVRVDFLTPNEGADTDEPQLLPALQTHAQPLRFLDFLIHDAQPAAMLHGSGVYINVPEPQRYAIHKLIIAQRRSGTAVKRDKDIAQADALLTVLTKRQPGDVMAAWQEAAGRGKKWRDLLVGGMRQLPQTSRDLTLKTIEQPRSIVPGLDLRFQNPAPRYDSDRDIVSFIGEANGETVSCAISGEALEDHFAAASSTNKERLAGFQENRSAIEEMARAKYLTRPVEEPGSVLVKTLDVPGLLAEIPRLARRLK